MQNDISKHIVAMKIVVFDLDETLGYFTEFGIFWDSLLNYMKDKNQPRPSQDMFNAILDLYPEFLRPNIINILTYLKERKQCKCCHNETKYLKITDTFESQKASLNLQADFTKLFNNLKFATLFLSSIIENNTNSFFYHTKICNVLPLTEAKPIALLQVFRL